MRYVRAKYKEYDELLAYRIYFTDTLFYQGQGKAINMRYIDLINKKQEPQDNRSGDEIAEDVFNRLGLKIDGCI